MLKRIAMLLVLTACGTGPVPPEIPLQVTLTMPVSVIAYRMTLRWPPAQTSTHVLAVPGDYQI